MSTFILFSSPRRCDRWLAVWLLWLLSGSWLAHGQSASPFEVRVSSNSTTTPPNSLPAGGSVVLTASAVYPPFSVGTGFATTNPSPGVKSYAYTVAFQPNGKILVGGEFTSYDGTPCQYIARLESDGSFDNSFRHTTSGGLNALLLALTLQPNGKIIVAGDFTEYGGIPHRYIARLKGNGDLDPTFAPTGAGFTNSPNVMVLRPDGKILVGGNFTSTATGTAVPVTLVKHIALLDSTGNLDTSFLPVGPAATAGLNAAVNTLAIQPDGKVLVGGDFTKYNGTTRSFIARLNDDGSLDTSFDPAGANFNARVKSLVFQPDGKILVGGEFTGYVARLNADGSPDPTFNPASANLNDYVASLILQPDGKVVVGGNFKDRVVRLAANGSLDPTFTKGTGFDDAVWTLARQPNGQVVVGGIFSNYSSTLANRKNIARLNLGGSLNTSTAQAVPGATYAWNNGSTGPTLAVVAAGSYSATATADGLSLPSNVVTVTTTTTASPLTVRVTPTGPLSLCANASVADRTLTAQIVPAPSPTATLNYQWWQVVAGVATPVLANSKGNTYEVPASVLAAGSPVSYFVEATLGTPITDRGASPTVTVSVPLPPSITAVTPSSGLPGTSVAIDGANLGVVTGVSFGGVAALFTRTSATRLVAIVPAGVASSLTVSTACAGATATYAFNVSVAPTLSSFAAQSGPVGTTVTITGTGFTKAGTAAVYFNGILAPVLASIDTQIIATVPAGAVSGPITVITPGPQGGTVASASPFIVTGSSNVTINTTTSSTLAAYTNLTIIAPGSVTLTHDISVSGRLDVQAGATLHTGSFKVLHSGAGPGSTSYFALAPGGTLTTSDADGFSATGVKGTMAPSGAIQLSTCSFSSDATYGYTGVNQITGTGLPKRVRNLICATSNSLVLTQPVSVAQVLTMTETGNFYLNNQMLTLLSGASGTALVHNQGTGTVIGVATVQRYIDPRVNPTAGFRYYGSPVRGATAAVFKTPAFTYDQRRSLLFTRQDTLPDISYGFVPTPLASNTFLEVGQGYRAAVPAADTVRFVGALTTGNDTVNLLRSSRKAYSGWNLVSNPYPSPLNWNKVDPADRPGLEAAIYVYESTGPGTGYFRNYVYKKVGTGDSLIAAGQAFFVRVSKSSGTQASTGQLIFRNSQRVTTFDSQTQPTFNRIARVVEPELDIEFERNKGCRPCRPTSTAATLATQVPSRVQIYTNANATAAFDPQLDADAGNLINVNQQTLGIRTGTGIHSNSSDTLAVQALPPLSATSTTRVPLVLGATAPGVYTLNGTGQNLPALLNGTTAYLRDSSATTNNWILLPTPTPYAFLLTAAELLAKTKPIRFWIHFGPTPSAPLTTMSSAALQSATVYPNPAREQFSVWVPAVAGATSVQATLLNSLGQVVQQQLATLPAAGTTLQLAVPGERNGLYMLRLQAGSSTIVRRVALMD